MPDKTSTEARDGFIVKTFGGEEVSFIPCDYNHERMRERVLMGLLHNLRDDCYVVDTRDEPQASA